MTLIYNFLVNRFNIRAITDIPYSRNHRLRPLYDFQKAILKRGGKISRHSDLLAYFEKRSLVPELKITDILFNLANGNEVWNNKNYERTKDLISMEMLLYPSENSSYDLLTPNQRIKKGDKPYPGFGHTIPSRLLTGKEDDGYFLHDHEFVLRRNNISHVIIIDPKYVDIFRLIKNSYDPCQNRSDYNNKIILAALILGVSMVLAFFILAQSFRYEVRPPNIFDKWTGVRKDIKY